MKKIGFLGGTFDPIHLGHLTLAKKALNDFNLDELYFLIARSPYHKNYPAIAFKDRKKMVAMAIKDEAAMSILEIPSKLEKDRTYTFEILEYAKSKIKGSFFYILGFDSFRTLESWFKWKELAKITNFIVSARGDKNIEDIIYFSNKIGIEKITNILELSKITISSTDIRNGNKESRIDAVDEYIREKGIYREN